MENSVSANSSLSTKIRNIFETYTFPYLLLFGVIGFFASLLFTSIFGSQSTQIGLSVHELENACRAEIWSGLCRQSLPKIFLFYILLGVWLIISYNLTLKLFDSKKSPYERHLNAIIFSLTLPTMLFIKYLVVSPNVISKSPFFLNFPFLMVFTVMELFFFYALIAFYLHVRQVNKNRLIVINSIFLSSIVLFFVLALLFAYYPSSMAQYFGSLNTIILFAIISYAFWGSLLYYAQMTRLPVVSLGLAACLVIFVANSFINYASHNINGSRSEKNNSSFPLRQLSEPGKADEQFRSWFRNRLDRSGYSDEYPVYVVASAGGGFYAAMRTAYILDLLQQLCPAFAHHIFAISGVSGGGIGALAYAAQQKEAKREDLTACTPLKEFWVGVKYTENKILNKFFAKDFLAPLLGAGLFSNLVNFSLFQAVGDFDRSRAFNKALGEYWREAVLEGHSPTTNSKSVDSQGKCSIEDYFSDCKVDLYWNASADVPFLIFNTTSVDLGMPAILSDLDPKYYGEIAPPNKMFEIFDQSQTNLIEGVSLSARFPLTMPAGIVNRFRVVDGGYYDSSALQVAEAVKKKITEIKIDDIQTIRIKVHVISLRDRDYSITNYLQCGFGGQDMEFGAHAEAFLKARDQRSAVTVRYITEQDPDIIEFESDPYEGASLLDNPSETQNNNPSETQNNCTGYPLAWFFSQNSQRVFKTIMESTVVANLKNYSRTLHTDLLPR